MKSISVTLVTVCVACGLRMRFKLGKFKTSILLQEFDVCKHCKKFLKG